MRDTKRNKTQKLLEDACPGAVAVLTQVLLDDSLPRALRVDVAKDVLNRAYGKTAAAPEKQEDTVQTIALVADAKELSK
ncbi:MAG: hypothetical protein RSF00_09130 [Oscillospiraceae bacterium]